jgi:hypothetical protein
MDEERKRDEKRNEELTLRMTQLEEQSRELQENIGRLKRSSLGKMTQVKGMFRFSVCQELTSLLLTGLSPITETIGCSRRVGSFSNARQTLEISSGEFQYKSCLRLAELPTPGDPIRGQVEVNGCRPRVKAVDTACQVQRTDAVSGPGRSARIGNFQARISELEKHREGSAKINKMQSEPVATPFTLLRGAAASIRKEPTDD